MRVAAMLVLSIVLALPALAQTSRRIHAQELVEETLARHPEMATLVMHVTPPNGVENVIIASNIGRIGKKADGDDLAVIRTGKPNMEANRAGDRYGVELVFLDTAGAVIGALAVGFPYKPGDDTSQMRTRAEKIRDELRLQIPTLDKLFDPVVE